MSTPMKGIVVTKISSNKHKFIHHVELYAKFFVPLFIVLGGFGFNPRVTCILYPTLVLYPTAMNTNIVHMHILQ